MQEAERKSYLKAMGIQVYHLREQPETETLVQEAAASTEADASSPDDQNQIPPTAPSADEDLLSYMHMDQSSANEADEVIELTDLEPISVPDVNTLNWQELKDRIAGCRRCELCQTRTNTVFGVGNPNADVMVIGEAPGADEDAKGEPFVGKAGQLLDNMLKAIGLDRKKVFIANILKCRPPANRNPSVDEVVACESYLMRQIDLIKPKLILSVGGVSAKNLLKTDEAVGRLRQHRQQLVGRNIPIQVTYHPAYLLRKPSEKAKAWTDLKKLQQAMIDLDIN